MAGFAGCEAIRRIVGFAKVSDLESLDADQRLVAALAVLERAESLLDRSGDGRFS
jgi:5-methylthioribose kinase